MANKPIKEALGLGETITFKDGTHLPCVPATLADLEDAIEHWNTWVTEAGSIQFAYLPGKEKAKEALEELLFIATGRKISKDELKQKITVADGGKEVVAFIERFLGFVARGAAAEEQQQEG